MYILSPVREREYIADGGHRQAPSTFKYFNLHVEFTHGVFIGINIIYGSQRSRTASRVCTLLTGAY